MSKKKSAVIKMIPTDRINILNPRVRNQKIFQSIAGNISQVGLKKPITVKLGSASSKKDYDLVCGQGRLEIFIANGQKEIPAVVIDASEEDALVMSLIENLARKNYRSIDLLQSFELLKSQGYNANDIAKKTGLTPEYVRQILLLLEKGEERLISAVESGQIPITVAALIANTPNEKTQIALQEAYENNSLKGYKLLTAKRLLEQRQQQGKLFRDGIRRKKSQEVSVESVVKAYKKEADRKKFLTRKADFVSQQTVFIVEALRQLVNEKQFNSILKAEGLSTMPKQLADLISTKVAK